jgi:hypothetical protein
MVGIGIAIGTAGMSRAEAADRGLGTTDAPVLVRIRTHTPVMAILIQQATERSATFRRLVEAINASDGIVYVRAADCGHGVRPCLADVTAARPNRILRIQVATRKVDWGLMGFDPPRASPRCRSVRESAGVQS